MKICISNIYVGPKRHIACTLYFTKYKHWSFFNYKYNINIISERVHLKQNKKNISKYFAHTVLSLTDA